MDDPGGKSVGPASDIGHYLASSNYGYNNTNGSTSRLQHQGSLLSNPTQIGVTKVPRGNTSSLGQVNERSGLQVS